LPFLVTVNATINAIDAMLEQVANLNAGQGKSALANLRKAAWSAG
jgi:hypothetical protein